MAQDGVISLKNVQELSEEGQEAAHIEEAYIPLSSKPLLQRLAYPPRMSLGGLFLALFGAMAIMVSGFVSFQLPSPLNGWSPELPQSMHYNLQLPFALMIAALLGPFMGTAATLLFIGLGLIGLPVFANGGGWNYVFQPGFGYLLAVLPVGSWLGRTYHKAFQKNEKQSRSLKLLKKAMLAILTLHLIGCIYLIGLTIAGQLPITTLPGWVLRLTVEILPYDLLASVMLLCLVRQCRLCLWLILY